MFPPLDNEAEWVVCVGSVKGWVRDGRGESEASNQGGKKQSSSRQGQFRSSRSTK